MTDNPARPTLDTTVPHSARLWNYWLGGKDNFAPDRAAGDEIARQLPSIIDLAVADRAFLGRMVRHLVADEGIRQILDIGTGLPSADNTHQVAQSVAPESRIVYVDNDPLVLVHARALLASSPEGATNYVQADLNDPEAILREARRTLDFDQPVAITLLGIMHFILDDERAREVVRELVAAVPSGSYLAIAHGCHDINRVEADNIVSFWNEHGTPKIVYRSSAEIARFFDGLDLLPPGVVSCSRWRPGPNDPDIDVNQYCGVARKP
ncbi:SAM-dependent methyltransferase [Plantactinospora soyae]|uniref:O-methyltransferase involved in polyketide biosynthesis n=1 Tax=Plantactinospora soyae TaxID=1544732 RepID=A0A927M711_9ACTN|nr:SAM-dependent methyltransferase [Plantactinospora soyae]MBE1488187.1 O-methyltransferase involved in polyketide biosynthesis [Plantactinospora soyae]